MQEGARFVVFHKPGPSWAPGVPAFEQAGLQQHVEHFRRLLEGGKLSMGGPFIDERSIGMMIADASVAHDEIRRLASEDPAVRSGLLIFEIRPWMPALQS